MGWVMAMTTIDVLWSTFRNADRIGSEADALLAALSDELQRIQNASVDEEVLVWRRWKDVAEKWAWGHYWYVHSVKLKSQAGRTRKSAEGGTLTCAISFWRPEDEVGGSWDGAKRAKLYMAFNADKAASGAYWTGDDLVLDGDGNPVAGVVRRPPRLHVWEAADGVPWRESSWFFCVPVDRLNDRYDIIREVVRPFDQLLGGADQAEAFRGAEASFAMP